MDRLNALLELEHASWRALSTDGEAAAAFFSDVLSKDVLVLLPGGMVIDDRERVIESMRGTPWTSFELADERVLDLSPECAVVVYKATARRDGRDYQALFSSTYVREGDAWKLALHQQTPI
jgi:hypothetical protein